MENKNIREHRPAENLGQASADVPHEVLVVVSKLKAYIRARSGMNTSDAVSEVLSNHIRELCDRAIAQASSDGRKTVLDRDFKTHS